MRSESTLKRLGGALSAAVLAAGLASRSDADPMGQIRAQVQDQLMRSQMNMAMMNFPGRYTPGTDGIGPMSAYLEVFSSRGKAEGFGVLHVQGEAHVQPKVSFADLSGTRYFPEDTDSLRMWGLTGLPKGRNWAFILARGPVTAIAYHPARGVEWFTRAAPGTPAWLDEAGWTRGDSLNFLFGRPYMEAERHDLAMAVALYNENPAEASASGNPGQSYWALLNEADGLCRRKQFAEAEATLAKARAWDGRYPRLHFVVGQCLERQGKNGAALEAYRQAIRYGGLDPDFHKDVEKRILKLASLPTK